MRIDGIICNFDFAKTDEAKQLSFQDLDPILRLQNNTPVDDFCGLTPTEMHHLLYDSFGKNSPLNFRDDIGDSILDSTPFFRLTESFLNSVGRDKFIRLTPLGALPKRVLQELYGHGFIKDEHIESGITKLTREIDWLALRNVHIISQLTGAIKKTSGKLTLTKKGERFLKPTMRDELFMQTVIAFTQKFNWAYNDAYTDHPLGQLGWGFSVFLIDKFGDEEHTIGYYADKYLRAFPKFSDLFAEKHFGTPEEAFSACYGVRTFERFLEWFGLVKVIRQKGFLGRSADKIVRTDLLRKIFQFK